MGIRKKWRLDLDCWGRRGFHDPLCLRGFSCFNLFTVALAISKCHPAAIHGYGEASEQRFFYTGGCSWMNCETGWISSTGLSIAQV